MKISEVKNLPKIAAPGGRVVAERCRYRNLWYRTERSYRIS